MTLAQAMQATISHVTPLPNHFLVVHFVVLPLDGEHGTDEPEDHFRLISLAGVPTLTHLAGRWEVNRQVRIVSGGRGLAWPTGEEIEALPLIVSYMSRELRGDRLAEFLAPVRRPKKRAMH